MEGSKKIKISASLIFVKILVIVGLCFIIKQLTNDDPATEDFKIGLEYKLFAFALFILLVYFFTRPIVFYDESNFYIKRILQKETIISIKNIKSVFKNPFTVGQGTLLMTVEYADTLKDKRSVKFIIAYGSDKIESFIKHVKNVNPRVEVV